MEDFCNIHYYTSDQHVDSSESRITRDSTDIDKLVQFFDRYNPFPVTPKIMSIFSGIVGDDSINSHRAYEVGMKSVESIISKDFETVTFKRKDKVLSLKSINSSIKVNDEAVTINPLLLFQRLCVSIRSINDMKQYLKFELSPFPLSLFTENGLRKNVKSDLYKLFISVAVSSIPTKKVYFMLMAMDFCCIKLFGKKLYNSIDCCKVCGLRKQTGSGQGVCYTLYIKY